MPSFTDQLGRTITLDHSIHHPLRIISLVPSQTELLYALTQNPLPSLPTLSAPPFEVVGITKFCVHPDHWFRTKPRVGGTKDIRPEKIAELQPDLIIANKEENVREQIESLATRYPVWVSDIHDLTGALAMIRCLGDIVGRPGQAQTLADQIESNFATLTPFPASYANPSSPPPPSIRATSALPDHNAGASGIDRSLDRSLLRTAYLIWRTDKPLSYMAAGRGTFIDDMLHRCGLINVIDQPRYPVTDPAALAASGCNLILLSSEPYPFRDKHREELQALVPHADIRLVDGEMFSWYGSRLLQAPAYFRHLLNKCE
jgi:ABC-type Fe3+-hydroxamate transport system substrate-binding protein